MLGKHDNEGYKASTQYVEPCIATGKENLEAHGRIKYL